MAIKWSSNGEEDLDLLQRIGELERQLVNVDYFDTLQHGFLVLDLEWRIVYINKQAANPQGFEPESLIGEDLWQSFPQLLGTPVEAHYRQALEEMQQQRFEYQGGSQGKWYEIYVFPAADGISVYWQDKTEQKQVEEALRRERELLQKVFDRIPVMISMYRPDTHVLHLNKEFERLTGWTTEEARQVDLMEKCYPDPEYRESVRAYMGSLEEGWQDIDMTTKDGGVLSSSWTNLRLSDDTHIGIGVDIRERKRSRQALRESEERLQRLVSIMPSAMYTCDADGVITYYNRRAAELWGREPKLGDSDEKFCGSFRLYRPDGSPLPHNETPMAEAVFKGQPARNEEVVIERPDGSFIIVSVNIDPLYDEGGQLTGAINTFQDITDKKRAEQALLESEQRLSLAQEAAGIGVWDWDMINRTQLWSPKMRELYGVGLEEKITDEKEMELIHPEDRAPVSESIQKAIEQREDWHGEFRIQHPVLGERWIEGFGRPIYDAEGRPVRMTGINMDITARKQAEQAIRTYAADLERSNRDLQDFTFIASHDLQEPLRKIRAFGDLLVSEYRLQLEEKGQDYILRMQDASQRMQAMIDDLLSYSRVTTKAQPFIEVDLNQVAREVISDLEIRIQNSGGRVELGNLPVIQADMVQMRQLLQNLVGNALKFGKPGVPPLVKVWAQLPSRQKVEVFVNDNGIGFDERYLERIFQPFQRLYGRGVYEGSGIGLAICRKIVERHHGAITAKSVPGQGTCFIITLPVKQNVG